MKVHTVQPGESLSLIARKYGIGSWQEIYSHGANAAFRAKRPNPNMIFPGDQIHIPAINGQPAANAAIPAPPLPKGHPDALIEMVIEGQLYRGTRKELDKVVDAAVDRLREKAKPIIQKGLEFARTEYRVYDELVKSDPFVSHTLDLFTPGDLTPSDEAMREAEEALRDFELALASRFVPRIESKFSALEKKANHAIAVYSTARQKLAGSATVAVPVLEWTRDISFITLSVAATIYSGGATTGMLATKGGALTFQALIGTVKTASDQAGKYLAGYARQTAWTATANISTAFVSSIVVDKIFKHPKLKEVLGRLAYKIAPKISPASLGIQIVKTGSIKDFLERFFAGVGKDSLKTAWTESTKAATGEKSFDQMTSKVLDSPVAAGEKTLKKEFVDWMVKEGIAKRIIK